VVGMPHRGRLNVLTQVMGKPHRALFHEFKGGSANPDAVEGSGDVKYHLGASSDREFDNNRIHLSLTANPSHLEIVDPVVLGKVRAKQDQHGDPPDMRISVLPLLMHGDANDFAGMGERAVHLQAALLDAVALLVATTTHGEAGYMAWRQAIVEECIARCESWRWRIRTFDPTAWDDFDRAWSAKAAAKAAEAITAAGHATARADKAQAQALRVG